MTEYTLSKDVLDIGFFTANLDDTLAFWNKELGLLSDDPVPYNNGLRQFRLPFRNTIIKVNCAEKTLAKPPTGYSELYLAVENISSPKTIVNPDGELITLVPVDFNGIKETAIKVKVNNLMSHANFYENVMGFKRKNDRTFQVGNCLLFLDKVEEEEWFTRKYKWDVVDPSPHLRPLASVLETRPDVAWGALHSRLQSGRR